MPQLARKAIERYLRPTSKGGPTPDHSGLETREPASGPSGSGHVHPVLSAGDGQYPSTDSASYPTVEAGHGEARDYTIAPPMPGHADSADLVRQNAQDCSGTHDLRDLARSSEAHDPYRARGLELLDMECQGKTHAAHGESSHLDDQRAKHVGGTGRADSGS